MHRYFFKSFDEPCWEPLEQVAELTVVSPDLPVIDPGHFMYMARLQAGGRPDLHLYKHFYTRRYLNLDDGGHAYAFAGEGRTRRGKQHLDDAGLYRPLPDLRTALGYLDLGFLETAWMTDHDRESLARLVARSCGGPARRAGSGRSSERPPKCLEHREVADVQGGE